MLSNLVLNYLKTLKLFDWLMLGVAITVSLTTFVMANQQKDSASRVAIQAEGKSWLYDINQDTTIELNGPLGPTLVEIQEGKVRVKADPGPLQICVRDGWIANSGEWLICLPNKVFIRIEGGPQPEESPVDASAF